MEKMNTAMRNRQADSLGSDFDVGVRRIYTGAQPATGDITPTGTLLVEITFPADAYGVAASGVATLTASMVGTAVAAGDAGWFRDSNAAGTRSIDGSVYKSGLTTTLSSAVAIGDATINVATTVDFGSEGEIMIGTEKIRYTGKTATTFTGCTRGRDNTTQAAAASGAAVTASGELPLNTLTIASGGAVTISTATITQPAS